MSDIANFSVCADEVYVKLNPDVTQVSDGIEYKLSKTALKNSSTNCSLRLVFQITNTSENPTPFDIRIALVGVFSFTKELPEDVMEGFLSLQAVQMLFPYLRSVISNVMTSALIPPIILPVMNVKNINFTDN